MDTKEKIIDEKFENQIMSFVKECITENKSFLLAKIDSENITIIGNYSPINLSDIVLHLIKAIESKYHMLYSLLLLRLLKLKDLNVEFADQSKEL